MTSIAVANDSDGLVDADDYVVDPYSRPGRVVPVSTWPSVTAATNLILIRYISGFGEDSDGGQRLPFMARNAMLITLAHLYKNREEVPMLPTAADALLRPLRVRLGMA